MTTSVVALGGLGLAAPQVGINRRPFVARIGSVCHTFVNPGLVNRSVDLDHMVEGCLSVPDHQVNVARPWWVDGSYTQPDGTLVPSEHCENVSVASFPARLWLHELALSTASCPSIAWATRHRKRPEDRPAVLITAGMGMQSAAVLLPRPHPWRRPESRPAAALCGDRWARTATPPTPREPAMTRPGLGLIVVFPTTWSVLSVAGRLQSSTNVPVADRKLQVDHYQ